VAQRTPQERKKEGGGGPTGEGAVPYSVIRKVSNKIVSPMSHATIQTISIAAQFFSLHDWTMYISTDICTMIVAKI